MSQRFFPNWRDEFANTKYPFSDSASLTGSNGLFFTEGVFLDASLYPIGSKSRLYISQVIVAEEKCTIVLGDSANAAIATGEFAINVGAEPTDSEDVLIPVIDRYSRAAGTLLSTTLRLATFQTWPTGTHDFTDAETIFCASVHIPTPEVGVRGFLLDSGEVVSGDVWLVGDDGVVLTYEQEPLSNLCNSLESYPVITVNIVGDPLFQRKLCEAPELFTSPQFIEQLVIRNAGNQWTINPDSFGDFKILIGSALATQPVLRAYPEAGGLFIGVVGEKPNR